MVCDTLIVVNLVTDLGLVSGAFDLEDRLRRGTLTTPLRLPDGTMLFVWQGRADAVELATWMPSFPDPPPFTRLAGSDVWVLILRLPATAMIEYRIGVGRHGRRAELIDPLNPATTTNPFGSNSVATGAAYELPAWAEPRADVVGGHLGEIRIRSRVWGERRHHGLYLPRAPVDSGGLPLVVVHDGDDFVNHSRLLTVIDNLVADDVIPPVAALLHRPQTRHREYADDPRHAEHIVDEVLSHVSERADIDPGRRLLVGSSLGAVAALSVGWRHPDQFSTQVLLSGSFAGKTTGDRPGDIFEPVVGLVERVDEDGRLADHRIYLSCGRYEGLIDLNRALVPRLRAVGASVRYEETWDGHQWASWRDRLGPALAYALR